MKALALLVASFAAVAVPANATPLRMEYCVEQVGLEYEYSFALILDNNDGSWSSGQGFGWLIFGAASYPHVSTIFDFEIDPGSYPIGPFTYMKYSTGGLNGPTLGPVVFWSQVPPPPNLWVPVALGDRLEWSGRSAALVAPGAMGWASLTGSGGPTPLVAAYLACGECYPDCDGSGSLSIADFACFQSSFVAGEPYADCDQSGTHTIADFACFQGRFAAGCP